MSLPSPSPEVELDCGSQSTSKVVVPAAAKLAARLMLVVVFPTPPFWLAMAMTLDIVASGSQTLRPKKPWQAGWDPWLRSI